jgi:hypothetical protein
MKNRRWWIRLGTILFIVTILSAFCAIPVMAYLDNPSSMSVQSVRAFRNIVVDGDVVILFHANISFSGSYPSTPASDTITFRLYDTDGISLKASATPYIYSLFENNGYGDIISGFYLTSLGVWGSAYKIGIYGSPIYFSGLTPAIYDMQAVDWNSESENQTDQRDAMADYIYELCEDFSTIYSEYPLAAVNGGGVKSLSQYGENYLLGAIEGIYSMCPQVFFSNVHVPTRLSTQEFTMQKGIDYGHLLDGTDIERGLNRLGAYIDMSGKSLAVMFVLFACLVMLIVCYRKGWGWESGAVADSLLSILAAVLIGDTMYRLMIIGGLLAIIGLAWYFFHKRAA